MKIFISWSRQQSKAIAEALNWWLPMVIQAVEPFYSPEIEKGTNWNNEIVNAPEGTSLGIICLTPDNLDSTWIHFEAGLYPKLGTFPKVKRQGYGHFYLDSKKLMFLVHWAIFRSQPGID